VSRKYPKILRNRKQRIDRRLKPRAWPEQEKPMFAGSNIYYEMAEKTQAMGWEVSELFIYWPRGLD